MGPQVPCCLLLLQNFFSTCWVHSTACRILVSLLVMEPVPSAVEVQSSTQDHQGSPSAGFYSKCWLGWSYILDRSPAAPQLSGWLEVVKWGEDPHPTRQCQHLGVGCIAPCPHLPPRLPARGHRLPGLQLLKHHVHTRLRDVPKAIADWLLGISSNTGMSQGPAKLTGIRGQLGGQLLQLKAAHGPVLQGLEAGKASAAGGHTSSLT